MFGGVGEGRAQICQLPEPPCGSSCSGSTPRWAARPGVPPPLTRATSAPSAAPAANCSAPSSAAGTVRIGNVAGRAGSGRSISSFAQRGVAAQGVGMQFGQYMVKAVPAMIRCTLMKCYRYCQQHNRLAAATCALLLRLARHVRAQVLEQTNRNNYVHGIYQLLSMPGPPKLPVRDSS